MYTINICGNSHLVMNSDESTSDNKAGEGRKVDVTKRCRQGGLCLQPLPASATGTHGRLCN